MRVGPIPKATVSRVKPSSVGGAGRSPSEDPRTRVEIVQAVHPPRIPKSTTDQNQGQKERTV